MAPKYKVTYFKIKGKAEPIRMLLAYGKQEFEDNFVERSEMPQIKSTLPFGKIPVLEVDGKVYHQSAAISRYLAKKFGLAGSNDEESFQIDILVDTFEDWQGGMRRPLEAKDEQEKAAAKNKILTETIPYYADKFEEIVRSNGGYFVNGKLTLADIRFVTSVDFISKLLGDATDVLAQYPNLKCLQKKVLEEPNIKSWLSRRTPVP